jgi:hypothetical protein
MSITKDYVIKCFPGLPVNFHVFLNGPLFDTFVKIFRELRSVWTILLLFILSAGASAQSDTNLLRRDTLPSNFYILHNVERNGVILPEIEMKEVVIIGRQSNSKKFPFGKYQRMVYNLKKVYPYALVVRGKLAEINNELMKIPDENGRKKYLRQVEKNIFGEYEGDVRDMTITQGKLLIKLIDRETSNTSYQLIQQYRGNFTAAFWQAIARIFGTNLKEQYDPYGNDIIMEIIIQEIEAGKL